MDIKDKVVLVTGASTGIGLAVARLLWKEGAKLALNARSVDKLNQLSGELAGSEVFPGDMADEGFVRDLVQNVQARFGHLDILINNAGRGMDGPLEAIDIKEYRRLLDLNFIGPLAAMQAAIPIMRSQGGGSIVNISSGTTRMYAPGLSGYSATKRALNGLSLTARNELADDNIAVSVIYPYITETDFYENLISSEPGHKAIDELVAGRAPADSAEYVAELIRTAILTGDAEIYAHDWMKPSMK